jgi:hypothetical protein
MSSRSLGDQSQLRCSGPGIPWAVLASYRVYRASLRLVTAAVIGGQKMHCRLLHIAEDSTPAAHGRLLAIKMLVAETTRAVLIHNKPALIPRTQATHAVPHHVLLRRHPLHCPAVQLWPLLEVTPADPAAATYLWRSHDTGTNARRPSITSPDGVHGEPGESV